MRNGLLIDTITTSYSYLCMECVYVHNCIHISIIATTSSLEQLPFKRRSQHIHSIPSHVQISYIVFKDLMSYRSTYLWFISIDMNRFILQVMDSKYVQSHTSIQGTMWVGAFHHSISTCIPHYVHNTSSTFITYHAQPYQGFRKERHHHNTIIYTTMQHLHHKWIKPTNL